VALALSEQVANAACQKIFDIIFLLVVIMKVTP
jgi:hypothetical protein